jgi:hypothetical protein
MIRSPIARIKNMIGWIISHVSVDGIMAFFTIVIALAAIGQYFIFSKQLNVIQNQLDEPYSEQRPWIYADITPGGPIFRNQSGGLTIQVAFTLHNVGHLPAFYVSPDVDGYLSGGSTMVTERQKAVCSRPVQYPGAVDQLGGTVFPGQSTTYGLGIGIGAGEIANAKSPLEDFISPWIVGCIRYKSPDGKDHQTGVALTVGMIKTGVQGTFALPKDPTAIDPGFLVISPWIVAEAVLLTLQSVQVEHESHLERIT